MKEEIEAFSKVVGEVRKYKNSFFQFVLFACLILLMGIIGISNLSKLPEWFNVGFAIVFSVTILFILIRTFLKGEKNTAKYLMSGDSFENLISEKLTDSSGEVSYSSIEMIEENSSTVPQSTTQIGENK